MQYFFPSIEWKSENEEYKIEADWLYRNYSLEAENEPRTIFNFTLFSNTKTIVKKPGKIVLTTNHYKLVIPENQIKIIYIDKGKTRYTSWLTSQQMTEFIAAISDNAEISIVYDKIFRFESSKNFQAHISYFQEVILASEN